jgi:hypothetical protein
VRWKSVMVHFPFLIPLVRPIDGRENDIVPLLRRQNSSFLPFGRSGLPSAPKTKSVWFHMFPSYLICGVTHVSRRRSFRCCATLCLRSAPSELATGDAEIEYYLHLLVTTDLFHPPYPPYTNLQDNSLHLLRTQRPTFTSTEKPLRTQF